MEYKIVVLGANNVGKSALMIQVVANHFVDRYEPPEDDSFRKQTTIDDEVCLLHIFDSSSEEQNFAQRNAFYESSVGLMTIYSIASRASFEEIPVFCEQMKTIKNMDVFPMVLVGNKNDLEDERQVNTEEGQELANAIGCPFFETSALTRTNCEECYYELVREVKRHNRPEIQHKQQIKKKNCIVQ